MKKTISIKALIKAFAFLFIASFAFVFMLTANSMTAYAASYTSLYEMPVGSVGSGNTSCGNWTFSQGVGATTSKPEFEFIVDSVGDTVTLTYNNSSTKYNIDRITIGASVSIATECDLEVILGTQSLHKTLSNNNNITYDFDFTSSTGDVVLKFTATVDSPYPSIPQIQFWVNTVKFYEKTTQYKATITAGTGVKLATVSKYEATSINYTDPSGTAYDIDTTVYGYAQVYPGYDPQSSWVRMGDWLEDNITYTIYRIGSLTIDDDNVDFGTINAIPKQTSIELNANGGSGGGNISVTYGEASSASANGFSLANATFASWNTKADGTGNTYTTALSISDVNELILDEVTVLYAKWAIAENIQAVIDKINLIGDVTLDSENAINTARSAYNALAASEKTSIINYNILEAAEARLEEIKANIKAGDNVKNLIDSIGEVSYPNSGDTITSARNAYNALTNDEQKSRVTNLDILEAAKIEYATLKQDAIDNVVNLINLIGDVEYTAESKELIDEAREAYDLLRDEDKALVANYDKFTTAENKYNDFEHDHNIFVGWMIALAIIGGIIIILGIAYLLLFFVFNKWTKVNDKTVRVFKIGKKDEKIRLMKMNFIIIYRNEDEVFNLKNDIK